MPLFVSICLQDLKAKTITIQPTQNQLIDIDFDITDKYDY